MQSRPDRKNSVMNHEGEADSSLKEAVLGIAFPLTAPAELLKYLPSLLGTYIKLVNFYGRHITALLPNTPCPPTLSSR